MIGGESFIDEVPGLPEPAPNLHGQKVCKKCGETKPLDEFPIQKMNRDGRAGKCRVCWREDYAVWRAANLSRINEKRRSANQRDPLKRRARERAYHAAERGEIVRPEECERCGTVGPVDAHHEDYAKPLDVIWLCKPCHGKEPKGIDRIASIDRFGDPDVRAVKLALVYRAYDSEPLRLEADAALERIAARLAVGLSASVPEEKET